MILFDSTSLAPVSDEFKLDRQITVTAFGLAAGDSVEFELLRGHMANIPGTPCCNQQQFVIDQVVPMSCGNGQQRIKLTPDRPVIVIDTPQGEYIRAKYTGSTLSAINVSYENSTVANVTDSMRGCLTCCPSFAGETGATGPQGPQGLTGATGVQGPIGLTGAVGPTGPAGPAGSIGPAGPAGADGAAGPQGPNGATGAVGPQGPVGATGSMGPQGVPGESGAEGPQGPAGPAGPQGPAGPAGPAGPQGPAGADGIGGATTDGDGIDVTGTGVSGDPYVVSVEFADAATTIAGTVLSKSVTPGGLYERENIPAQTGLSNDVTAIPPPGPDESPWGQNQLLETLHYAPGLGWQIVSKYYGDQVVQPAGVIPLAASTWGTAVSLVAPRAGRVNVTGHVVVNSSIFGSLAGGIAISGVHKTSNDADSVGPINTTSPFAGGTGTATHNVSSLNASVSWTGDVVAGDVIQLRGITIGAPGQVQFGNLEYTYD